MKNIYTVICLENDEKFIYTTNSSIKALENHLYFLNSKNKDKNAYIKKCKYVYYLTHNNKTYGVKI